MSKGIKSIAYYLPQYHPVAENDMWWGKGFTEWTNVTKAKPLYKGHKQPIFPADLGYYDLRVPEVREAQAEMAKAHGIYGFCYYHYWFGNGRQLLERPFNEVLASKKPDFPFMLCWANQTWTGHWFGADKRILVEQQYPGDEDIEKHFNYLKVAFEDERYIKIEEKPVFKILDVENETLIKNITEKLRDLAHKSGLKGLYLIAGPSRNKDFNAVANGFDAQTDASLIRTLSACLSNKKTLFNKLIYNSKTEDFVGKLYFNKTRIIEMKDYVKNYNIHKSDNYDMIPVILPNWDNTPRSGALGLILKDSLPAYFENQIKMAIKHIEANNKQPLLFIKSWNEWAEGNYLEPDTEWGFDYLKVCSKYFK